MECQKPDRGTAPELSELREQGERDKHTTEAGETLETGQRKLHKEGRRVWMRENGLNQDLERLLGK